MAVKEGGGAGPDGQLHACKDAIAKAKANNVPNDNIDRIIKKAAGEGNDDNYESVCLRGVRPQRHRRDCGNPHRQPEPHRGRSCATILTNSAATWAPRAACPSCSMKKGVIVIERGRAGRGQGDGATALEAGASDFAADEDVFEISTEPDDFSARPRGFGEEGLRVCFRRGGDGPRHLHHH